MGDAWDDLLGNGRCEEIDFGTAGLIWLGVLKPDLTG
jgi:hypothetical protein